MSRVQKYRPVDLGQTRGTNFRIGQQSMQDAIPRQHQHLQAWSFSRHQVNLGQVLVAARFPRPLEAACLPGTIAFRDAISASTCTWQLSAQLQQTVLSRMYKPLRPRKSLHAGNGNMPSHDRGLLKHYIKKCTLPGAVRNLLTCIDLASTSSGAEQVSSR